MLCELIGQRSPVPHMPHPEFLIFVPHAITNVVKYIKHEKVFYQDIYTPRSGFKKKKNEAQPRFFKIDLEVCGYLIKHSFKFLIWLLKPLIVLGEIQSKRLENFMLIKIRYSKHRHLDFLRFLFMNY